MGKSETARRDALLEQALRALSEAAREELSRHPQGHLAAVPRGEVAVDLRIPLGEDDDLGEPALAARKALRRQVESWIALRAVWRPGRVLNLRTGSAEGADTAPPDGRFVFGGYSPSGVPRFVELGQWLLQIDHPGLDRVYRRPPELVTAVSQGRDLRRELLPAFDDHPTEYHIRGQVAAGWFQVPRRDGTPGLFALTFQVVSSGRGASRRLGLNVLGAGPDGETLDEVADRLDRVPWRPVVDWAQGALDSVGRSRGRQGSSAKGTNRRIEGVLGGIARRLEQDRRARGRRTGHAERRHRQGERPTPMALRDLARAADDHILWDERHGTLVVLGERGRAHVFSPEGKLVTSIRYSPDSIERKKKLRIWRPATAEESHDLRRSVVTDRA